MKWEKEHEAHCAGEFRAISAANGPHFYAKMSLLCYIIVSVSNLQAVLLSAIFISLRYLRHVILQCPVFMSNIRFTIAFGCVMLSVSDCVM